ncbi:MAG: vitamin B12-dependent ribonucleotide reductase, partial [Actinomycetes bacterium]
QYGVPLQAFVDAFVGMRFEPAGITDDPELRIATSLIDYLFRRLALEYLSVEDRTTMGILSSSERTQPTLPGVDEQAVESSSGLDIAQDPPSVRVDLTEAPASTHARPSESPPAPRTVDAPLCMTCGVAMTRAGSCFVCAECGATSGCS